jgi:hypothetical protein
VLRGCYRIVTSVFKNVTRVSQERYKGVTGMVQECYLEQHVSSRWESIVHIYISLQHCKSRHKYIITVHIINLPAPVDGEVRDK